MIIPRRRMILGAASIIAAPAIIRAQVPMTGAGVGAPSSAVQNPSAIFGADLVAWYDAHTGVTAPGGTLTGWADQSGNGRNISSINGVAPTYSATGFNSRPGITMLSATLISGGNYINGGTYNIGGGNSVSLFFVGNITNAAANDRVAAYFDPTSGNDYADPNGFLFPNSSAANTINAYQNSTPFNAMTVTDGTNARFGMVINSTTGTLYLNGASQSTTSISSTTFGTSSSTLFIGGRGNQTAGFTAAEVVFVKAGATGTQVTNLDNWFKSNWGL